MGVSRRDFLLLSGSAVLAPAVPAVVAVPEVLPTWHQQIAAAGASNMDMHLRVMEMVARTVPTIDPAAFTRAMDATKVWSLGRPIIAINNIADVAPGSYEKRESGLSRYVTGAPHVA